MNRDLDPATVKNAGSVPTPVIQRKRSYNQDDIKSNKKLKTYDKQSTSQNLPKAGDNRDDNDEDDNLAYLCIQEIEDELIRAEPTSSTEESRVVRTEETITKSDYDREDLLKFWHHSIYECVVCEDKSSNKFYPYNWYSHIKNVHHLSRAAYTTKYGSPDVTNLRHCCYLCGAKFQQIYTVVKTHLKAFHNGLSVDDYTFQFRDSISQEQALQPVLPSNQILPGWTEGCEYLCTLCNKTVHSASQLDHHRKSDHKGVQHVKSDDQLFPSLMRLHTCYVCEKKLRHEYNNIYHHLHSTHKMDINKYASNFYDMILIELRMKGMQTVLDRALKFASRPSLDDYLEFERKMKQADPSGSSGSDLLADWANFCDYKCYCQETFSSQLKFHLHITRKHGFKSMPAYKLEHGDPSVVHRLHKCKLCKVNIKWEASRIRDHLKKHKDKSYTLNQYQEQFREEIMNDIQRLKNESTELQEHTQPFRYRQGRYGGTKSQYSQIEWKEFTRSKIDPFREVSCPSCKEVMKQSSLFRHVKTFHSKMMKKLEADIQSGRDIQPEWRNINLVEEEDLTNIDYSIHDEIEVNNKENPFENESTTIGTNNEEVTSQEKENEEDIPREKELCTFREENVTIEATLEIKDNVHENEKVAENERLVTDDDNINNEEETEQTEIHAENKPSESRVTEVTKRLSDNHGESEVEDAVKPQTPVTDSNDQEFENPDNGDKVDDSVKFDSIFVIDPMTGEITRDSSDKIKELSNLVPLRCESSSVYISGSSLPARLLEGEESDTESETGSLAGRVMFIPDLTTPTFKQKNAKELQFEEGSKGDSDNIENTRVNATTMNEVNEIKEKSDIKTKKSHTDDTRETSIIEDPESRIENEIGDTSVDVSNDGQFLPRFEFKSEEPMVEVILTEDTTSLDLSQKETCDTSIMNEKESSFEDDEIEYTIVLSEDCRTFYHVTHASDEDTSENLSGHSSQQISRIDISNVKVEDNLEDRVEPIVTEVMDGIVDDVTHHVVVTEHDKEELVNIGDGEISSQQGCKTNHLGDDVRCVDEEHITELCLVDDIRDGSSMLTTLVNDRTFQSMILGGEGGGRGGVQRITVLHRKDKEENPDKSALLTHISNLIKHQRMESESGNLKIIEIQVETNQQSQTTASFQYPHQFKNIKGILTRSRSKGKAGTCKNSHGFSIKTISLPKKHDNNTVSKGTQISKWTKVGEELQKVATHKILTARNIASGMNPDDCPISGPDELCGQDGVVRQSVATQVVWENRVRGVVDLDEENAARDKIASWFISSPPDLQTATSCPGCNKKFARNRNLIQHLQTKHGVHLTGTINEIYQRRMLMENCSVTCKHCGIKISRKSLRRHERLCPKNSGSDDQQTEN